MSQDSGGGDYFGYGVGQQRYDTQTENVQEKLRGGGWGCIVLVVVFLALVVWLFSSDLGESASFTSGDSDLYSAANTYSGQPIPNFTSRDEQRLSQALADLERTDDLCFGWRLEDGATGKVQYGSSRGPDTRATTCERWAEVRVGVGYTSASSPNYDAAAVYVATSSDMPQASDITPEAFAELGIDADALIADPVSATGHAALAVPLLLEQEGALQPPKREPSQSPSSKPQKSQKSLPSSDGGDFPVGTVVLLGLLGAGAVTALVFGIRATRRD